MKLDELNFSFFLVDREHVETGETIKVAWIRDAEMNFLCRSLFSKFYQKKKKKAEIKFTVKFRG